MVSRMALTCKPYAAGCTKNKSEILRPKNSENEKAHPKSPKKGETGCVLGAGERCSRCREVRKPEIRTKMNQIAMQHMKKRNRRKPSVFAGFVAGAEGLEPSARGFGVDVRTNHRERGRGGATRFPPQVTKRVVLVWCCEKKYQDKTRGKGGRKWSRSPKIYERVSRE